MVKKEIKNEVVGVSLDADVYAKLMVICKYNVFKKSEAITYAIQKVYENEKALYDMEENK